MFHQHSGELVQTYLVGGVRAQIAASNTKQLASAPERVARWTVGSSTIPWTFVSAHSEELESPTF